MRSNNSELTLQCRGFECSPALAQRVEVEHKKLARLAPGMLSCRVTLSREHRHRHQGCPYEAHIEVSVPGLHQLAATRDQHDEPYVALRNAFMAMHQQLESMIGRRHDRLRLRYRRGEIPN